MALQDLTPQLRTRLSRMERAVGWFVLLATLLLVSGFVYYIYHTAQHKGWFVSKVPYFTFTDRATGLKVGDPVKLMGFDVGQITRIDAQPPEDFTYNVYVEFAIKSPYYGYVWTVGSRARVNSADFLGKREVEITKGTGGYPTYLFNPLKEVTIAEAANLRDPMQWQLAEDIYAPAGTNRLFKALTPLAKVNLAQLAGSSTAKIRVVDAREQKKQPTAVWNDRDGRYDGFGKTNLYWLVSDESPAVTERLEKIVGQVEKALPNFLVLTNQLAAALNNTVGLTSNLNAVAESAKPAAANLAEISGQLKGQGALGTWLLSPDMHAQLATSLTNVNAVMVNADTNLTALAESLGQSLEHLANLTSNLNTQVQANTNVLKSISDAVVHADELVQGLKHHWLLRSAFKPKPEPRTNQPPVRLRSPRDLGNQ